MAVAGSLAQSWLAGLCWRVGCVPACVAARLCRCFLYRSLMPCVLPTAIYPRGAVFHAGCTTWLHRSAGLPHSEVSRGQD